MLRLTGLSRSSWRILIIYVAWLLAALSPHQANAQEGSQYNLKYGDDCDFIRARSRGGFEHVSPCSRDNRPAVVDRISAAHTDIPGVIYVPRQFVSRPNQVEPYEIQGGYWCSAQAPGKPSGPLNLRKFWPVCTPSGWSKIPPAKAQSISQQADALIRSNKAKTALDIVALGGAALSYLDAATEARQEGQHLAACVFMKMVQRTKNELRELLSAPANAKEQLTTETTVRIYCSSN